MVVIDFIIEKIKRKRLNKKDMGRLIDEDMVRNIKITSGKYQNGNKRS